MLPRFQRAATEQMRYQRQPFCPVLPVNYKAFQSPSLASGKTLGALGPSPQPDGWARGEREGYGEPRDVNSLSLSR